MHWTAKKLLDLYYIVRGTRTPEDALDRAGLPVEPDLEMQEEKLRAAKIDAGEFEFFYAYYYHQLLGFFYNRTRGQDVAEDLVSETFLRAQENLDRYRWTGIRFGSWLYRIATNVLIAWIESEKRRGEVPLPDNVLDGGILIDRTSDAETRVLKAEERALMERYLSRLEPEEQILLEMRFRQELSSGRIAEITGRPWGTVASRINRAVKKMQRMAEEDNARRE